MIANNKVFHEFNSVVNNDSKILILGSFPSVKSRESTFYYMHPQNRFWSLLSLIYYDDFLNEDINIKINLLKKYKIALYDVIESCNIIGSKDSTITNVFPTDINRLIFDTNINHIYLNGRKAYNLFLKYNSNLKSIATYLPSTSPANARYTLEDLLKEWKTIKKD